MQSSVRDYFNEEQAKVVCSVRVGKMEGLFVFVVSIPLEIKVKQMNGLGKSLSHISRTKGHRVMGPVVQNGSEIEPQSARGAVCGKRIHGLDQLYEQLSGRGYDYCILGNNLFGAKQDEKHIQLNVEAKDNQ